MEIRVWVVEGFNPYDGYHVKGVFPSEEKAMDHINFCASEWFWEASRPEESYIMAATKHGESKWKTHAYKGDAIMDALKADQFTSIWIGDGGREELSLKYSFHIMKG